MKCLNNKLYKDPLYIFKITLLHDYIGLYVQIRYRHMGEIIDNKLCEIGTL